MLSSLLFLHRLGQLGEVILHRDGPLPLLCRRVLEGVRPLAEYVVKKAGRTGETKISAEQPDRVPDIVRPPIEPGISRFWPYTPSCRSIIGYVGGLDGIRGGLVALVARIGLEGRRSVQGARETGQLQGRELGRR